MSIAVAELHTTLEDPHSALARQLLLPLVQELANRYPEEETDIPVPHGVDGIGGAFIVAWHGHQPAGCGALREMERGVAEIKRMYVVPSMREHGIGRLIINRLEAMARDMGYSSMRLETGVRQPEAIAHYESAGFTRISCYGSYRDNPFSVCFEKLIMTE